MSMKCSTAMTVARKAYDNIECALWAILLALVIYFFIFIAPNLPAAVRQADSVRAANNEVENSSYCEKWGMKAGTHEHTLCTEDLQELRKKIEREFSEDAAML